jgi:hypothetical protein
MTADEVLTVEKGNWVVPMVTLKFNNFNMLTMHKAYCVEGVERSEYPLNSRDPQSAILTDTYIYIKNDEGHIAPFNLEGGVQWLLLKTEEEAHLYETLFSKE